MAVIRTVLVVVLLVSCALGADDKASPAPPTPATSATPAPPAKPSPPSTEAPKTKKKVCEVCDCIDENIIDCSSRGLETNLVDYEWPTFNKTIKYLNFGNNKITQVHQFPNLTVEVLILRDNQIKIIDMQAFEYLDGLVALDLSGNLLTDDKLQHEALEGGAKWKSVGWESLDTLKFLNLSGNQFHTLDPDAFAHTPFLNHLILSNNPFLVFDHRAFTALSSLRALKNLDLSNCSLSELDQTTFNVVKKKLEILNLSYNSFKEIPHALRQIFRNESLHTLILDGNPIEILDSKSSIPEIITLKELNMRNMPKLREIKEEALGRLDNLEILAIENCPKLTLIEGYALSIRPEEGARTWPRLKKLFLSNNALQHLPIELLSRWDLVEEMHVMNNQWSCDCENQPFINFIDQENKGTQLMGNETELLVCSSPPEYFNQSFIHHKSEDCEHTLGRGIARENDAAILIGALIGVLLAVPVTLSIFILWTRGFFHCGRQNPSSFSRAFYKRTPRYDDDL